MPSLHEFRKFDVLLVLRMYRLLSSRTIQIKVLKHDNSGTPQPRGKTRVAIPTQDLDGNSTHERSTDHLSRCRCGSLRGTPLQKPAFPSHTLSASQAKSTAPAPATTTTWPYLNCACRQHEPHSTICHDSQVPEQCQVFSLSEGSSVRIPNGPTSRLAAT